MLWRNGRRDLGKASKLTLARALVAHIAESFAAARKGAAQRGTALG